MEYPHEPVLVHEVVKTLCHIPEGIYIDGTVGTGGHSLAISKSLFGKGRLICLDRDPGAVRLSKKRLAFLGKSISVVKANYADMDKIIWDLGIKTLDGVLLDLGMSSLQLENSGRGFSFNKEEPLDMRMDPDDEITAHHLVNNLSTRDLERILREYGEEKKARLIAGAIVQARDKKPIDTSFRLAGVIKSACPTTHRFRAKHPATRTFQALRIAVNRELKNIDTFFIFQLANVVTLLRHLKVGPHMTNAASH